MKMPLVSLFVLLLASPLTWAAPFSFSTDGSEVTDQATGLIWDRCVMTMVWLENECRGKPKLYTQTSALRRVELLAARTKKAWRLPNRKELSSLVYLKRESPAIYEAAFPGAPASEYMTSDNTDGMLKSARVIDFTISNSGLIFNRTSEIGKEYLVRTVRFTD